MPFPPDHKAKTHARIVKTASRLFRRDGYAGTGVDRLMAAAGLTRGGFYAHFRDKAALLGEAVDRAFVEARRALLEGELGELRGQSWLRRATETYLSPLHRKNPAVGCAIPTLGPEIARSPARIRKGFAANVEGMIAGFTERLDTGEPGARRRAITLFSTWIGAIVLSRAVGDDALGDEILAAVRDEVGAPESE